MKIVKITYTTKVEFAEQNQKNIQAVIAELHEVKYSGINYNACLCSDNKTFIHTAFFNIEDDQKLLNELLSFKRFQEQLKASEPENLPKQDILTLIGSSTKIFNS